MKNPYNRYTSELFNKINFMLPHGWHNIEIVWNNWYFYVFPQRCPTWHDQTKVQTAYFIAFWIVVVYHTKKPLGVYGKKVI